MYGFYPGSGRYRGLKDMGVQINFKEDGEDGGIEQDRAGLKHVGRWWSNRPGSRDVPVPLTDGDGGGRSG